MGAYTAGSCREASSSIYVIALAGAVLVYVVIHIVFFTLDDKANCTKPILEKRRKQLLLLAILTATLTYQAGLTPPGGFWLKNDEFGHMAGNPVLFDNYPRRYNAFFYCNAASFMASIALIILLVNPNLYMPGIECKALYACMVAGLFGLMGAYSAGSSRHLQTSIYVTALVAAVTAFIIVLLVSLWYLNHRKKSPIQTVDDTRNNSSEQEDSGTEAKSSMPPGGDIKGKDRYREQYNMRKYCWSF
jgi:NADH:ubiquinone oxidoreductase subunit 6 (subunit J)